MTEGIDKWITSRFEYMNSVGKTDLPFRPFLRWFDRKSEQLLTEALKEVCSNSGRKEANLTKEAIIL